MTNNIPKCLVPIHGIPLLAYWLKILDRLGVTEILINLHYLSEKVIEFVSSSPYKNKIILSEEKELIGTGGTLVTNRNFWQGQKTLVIHADNLCLSNLKGLISRHKNRLPHIDATLLLFRTPNPKSCGVVTIDPDGIITGFYEKVENPPTNLASGAIFLFAENVYDKYFRTLMMNTHYEISIDIAPKLVGKMQGWVVDDYYIDIGSPENYHNANIKTFNSS